MEKWQILKWILWLNNLKMIWNKTWLKAKIVKLSKMSLVLVMSKNLRFLQIEGAIFAKLKSYLIVQNIVNYAIDAYGNLIITAFGLVVALENSITANSGYLISFKHVFLFGILILLYPDMITEFNLKMMKSSKDMLEVVGFYGFSWCFYFSYSRVDWHFIIFIF